jgi:hypothetical protein
MKSLRSEKPVYAESVIPDKPARTAQSNLGRHFTHMHEYPFSQRVAQILIVSVIFNFGNDTIAL